MKQSSYINDIRKIAILSFEDSRKDLIEWSYAKKHILNNHIIISTARTASLLEGTLNTPVLNLQHGRSGGYQQVRSLLEENRIDIIIFFGNTLLQETRDSWFDELVNIAIRNNVVVAYNQATTDMLVQSIDCETDDAKKSEFIQYLRHKLATDSNGLVSLRDPANTQS